MSEKAAMDDRTQWEYQRSARPWQKLVVVAIVLAACVLAAVLYYSPVMAMRNMQQAIDRGDGAALADYVDFPALRENLKNTFTAKLMVGDGKEKQDGMNAMVAAFGSMVIGKMVDMMITPEGLAQVMRGKQPSKDRPEAKAGKGKPGRQTAPAEDATRARKEVEREWRYESWNRVVVSTREKGSDEPPLALVLQRHGLAEWKLAGIRLPD